MEWPNGLGMQEARMKCVEFVNHPLRVWHREPNTQEMSVRLSLENVGMVRTTCNGDRSIIHCIDYPLQ